MWPFRPRIEIIASEPIVAGEQWRVRIRNLPDLIEGGVLFVTGVGATRNEAANNAFKHAADLMFPRVHSDIFHRGDACMDPVCMRDHGPDNRHVE